MLFVLNSFLLITCKCIHYTYQDAAHLNLRHMSSYIDPLVTPWFLTKSSWSRGHTAAMAPWRSTSRCRPETSCIATAWPLQQGLETLKAWSGRAQWRSWEWWCSSVRKGWKAVEGSEWHEWLAVRVGRCLKNARTCQGGGEQKTPCFTCSAVSHAKWSGLKVRCSGATSRLQGSSLSWDVANREPCIILKMWTEMCQVPSNLSTN